MIWLAVTRGNTRVTGSLCLLLNVIIQVTRVTPVTQTERSHGDFFSLSVSDLTRAPGQIIFLHGPYWSGYPCYSVTRFVSTCFHNMKQGFLGNIWVTPVTPRTVSRDTTHAAQVWV